MICKGIYEVLTPSVRLSRFATHVETVRPRKGRRSIHAAMPRVCKTSGNPGCGSIFRLSRRFARQVFPEKALELGEHADTCGALRKPVILAGKFDQLD